jgi:hypothetical protein
VKRIATLFLGSAAILCLFVCLAPSPAAAQPGVVVVEMHPPFDPGGPFPAGWAVINIPKGDVTMLAILPKETHGHVFEGWLADLAPPHRCRIHTATDEVPGGSEELELNDERIAGAEVLDATPDDPDYRICGSRRSSETGFRGFPGLINKTFQHTYFPVSQGLFRRYGPALGDWQFYTARHKTNMGLRWADVVGVTVEPPGTGSPRRDYDPRPNPIVILAGRIPAIAGNSDGGDDGGGDEPPATTVTQTRRRAKAPVSVR